MSSDPALGIYVHMSLPGTQAMQLWCWAALNLAIREVTAESAVQSGASGFSPPAPRLLCCLPVGALNLDSEASLAENLAVEQGSAPHWP